MSYKYTLSFTSMVDDTTIEQIVEEDSFHLTIVLGIAPTADVNVEISLPDQLLWLDGTSGSKQLVFSNDNFSQAQTVELAGLDDLLITGDLQLPIQLIFSSSDPVYDGVSETHSINVIDNDFQRSFDPDKEPSGGNNHIVYDVHQGMSSELGDGNDWLDVFADMGSDVDSTLFKGNDPDDDNDGVFDTDDGDPLNADIGIHRTQLISAVGNPLVVNGQSIRISLNYDTSDGDNQLLGIGIRVHYSSEILTFVGTENAVANHLYANGDGPYQDESDFDNDLSTDKYIIFGWSSLISNWPDVSLPASLVDVVFNADLGIIDQTSITTPINFSKVSSTEGYNFGATNYTLTVLAATWDFDGNSEVDALTDGLLLMRYLFDVRGESLTSNIIAPDATMSHSQIALNMESNVVIADIDKDGEVDALTDGLLLLRYLFDARGESLISDVVSSAAERSTEAEIESYIEQYMPINY